MRPTLTLIAVSLGAVLVGGAAAVAHRAETQQTREELPQPPGWVPFAAKVSVVRGDSPAVVGAFYRASNGSTRLETGPSNDNQVRVISIKHVPSRTHFTRGTDGKWVSKPMDPHSVEFQPLRFYAGMPLLAAYPKKVSILKGQPYSLASESGYSAYQLMQDSGGVLLLVPELNFFPVVQERMDGRREVYSDVELGEPDPALFLPPSGAVVEVMPSTRTVEDYLNDPRVTPASEPRTAIRLPLASRVNTQDPAVRANTQDPGVRANTQDPGVRV